MTLDGLLAALDGRWVVTVPEAGALLGLGRSAAYAAAERGDLPTRRVGRRLVVPVPALADWIGLDLGVGGDVTVSTHDETPPTIGGGT